MTAMSAIELQKAQPAPRLGTKAQALAIFLLCAVAIRLPFLGDYNADVDEQLYSLIGNAMLHGALPFVDLWDRKPFGLFALYALAHAVGGPSPWAYQIFATGFVVLAAMLLRHLARRLADDATATGAGILFLLLFAIYGSHSGQTEVFHVPAMLAMAILVRDPGGPRAVSRALWAMAIGGVALQVKYTVLPQCLFFGLWALWDQWGLHPSLARTARLGALFAMLGVLPTALVGLSYLAIGEWDAFWFANFTSFFDRAPGPEGRFPADHLLFTFPLVTLCLAGLYGALRLRAPADRRSYAFFLLWLAASLATVYLPSTVYAYYFAALVPAVVLVALPVLDRRGPARLAPLILAIAGCSALLFYPVRMEASQRHRQAMTRLTAQIAPHLGAPPDCLWVFDGPTALYTATNSCLPTRFIYPDHLNNALERDALGVEQLGEVRRILDKRPAVVVTADRPFTVQNEEVLAFVRHRLERDYSPEPGARIHSRQLTVWIRRAARRE